jgi:hypothetical protein
MSKLRWSVLILLLSAAALYAGHKAKTLTAEKTGWYSASTRYPQFDDQTPVAKVANKVLSSWATNRQKEFIRQSTTALERAGKPGGGHQYTVDYEVTYAFPQRLLSIRFDTFWDTGGAHGMPEYVTYTFGMVKGKAQQLTLRHFFQPGSAYKDTVTAAILGKLKLNPKATLVVNGQVTSLTDKQLHRFSVDADGLTFFLNPYEVGPYSSGRFQIKLTVDELGPDFRRDLLLKP